MARRRGTRHGGIALALFGACASLACQDGYPIPATQCDVWCEQIRRADCGGYDPAGCVVACEKEGIGQPACADAVALSVACLRKKTDAELDCATWLYTGQEPCLAEQDGALACGAKSGQAGSQGAP